MQESSAIGLDYTYNNRMQPAIIQADTAAGTVLSLSYNYTNCHGTGTSATTDNGTICEIDNNNINALGNTNGARNQTFRYDPL